MVLLSIFGSLGLGKAFLYHYLKLNSLIHPKKGRQINHKGSSLFRVGEICVLADRGMVSESTITAFEAMESPVHYILGVRMRRQKEVGEVVLKCRKPWREITPERELSKDPAPFKVKEVQVGDHRYVVCLNEEERRKDAHESLNRNRLAGLLNALQRGILEWLLGQ